MPTGDELYGQMTRQQKLVYRACRWGQLKIVILTQALFRIAKRAYMDELEIQARRVGCLGQKASIRWRPTMAKMLRDARRAARSIVGTFNRGLANAILVFGAANPDASFWKYLRHLKRWERARNDWKLKQIQAATESQARADAIREFYERNRLMATATMLPLTAVCPVCQGWLDRIEQSGPIPIHIAIVNSPPYHLSCPHRWVTHPIQLSPAECRRLWMGK